MEIPRKKVRKRRQMHMNLPFEKHKLQEKKQ